MYTYIDSSIGVYKQYLSGDILARKHQLRRIALDAAVEHIGLTRTTSASGSPVPTTRNGSIRRFVVNPRRLREPLRNLQEGSVTASVTGPADRDYTNLGHK